MKSYQRTTMTSKPCSIGRVSRDPYKLVFFIASTIFLAESLLMILLDYMPPMPHHQEAFFDAFVLTMIVFPILYLCLFRPLTQQIKIRKISEEEKKKLIVELNNTIDKLKMSEKRSRDLFEYATDAIFIIDPDTGRIADCNLNAHERLGYNKEELVGMTIYNLNCELTNNAVDRNFSKQLAGEKICLETVHRKKDGLAIPVEVTSAMISIENKNFLQSFVRDISVRKKREQEKEQLIHDLKKALDEIKTLRGILPLCSFCKKIRNDKGYWEQVDVYIYNNSMADISHSICPECMKREYPEYGKS